MHLSLSNFRILYIVGIVFKILSRKLPFKNHSIDWKTPAPFPSKTDKDDSIIKGEKLIGERPPPAPFFFGWLTERKAINLTNAVRPQKIDR